MQTKKIILITSGQPSANPRLVKEAITLTSVGYKVKVIYCPLSPWADPFDEKLFQENPLIEWLKVGYHPVKEKWGYLYARIRQKFYKNLYTIVGNRFDIGIKSMVLFSQELESEAKRHPADLYMGHNLGAMLSVVKAAKIIKVFCSFDFEDFHRGEDVEGSTHWEKTKKIEDQYIPFLTFTTAASPLIGKEYQKLYPTLSVTVINNCFPLSLSEKSEKILPQDPLRLFWFSQTIGKNRGLETVIDAMGILGVGKITLSLLGNISSEIKKYFQSYSRGHGVKVEDILFFDPVNEKEIVKISSCHHVGLACEVPHVQNRELCLTNKVFMYLLSGNAIIFSNTKAQSNFLRQYNGIGMLYEQGDSRQLAQLLSEYLNDPSFLQEHKKESLNLAKDKFNWEVEKLKLINKYNEILEKY